MAVSSTDLRLPGESVEFVTGNPQDTPDVEMALVAAVKTTKDENTSRSGNQHNFKCFVLVFLTVQNSSASLLMRYSRSQSGASWNPQTGVVAQEMIKAMVCIVLLLRDGSLSTVFANRMEALKMAIPAICYLIQNNLQYVAVGYLDASTYAVVYQLKILTTALLGVVMLKKDLAFIQWVSLGLLSLGVSAVVVSQMSSTDGAKQGKPMDSVLPGLAAVLVACFMSGLAGVYFEKLLKGSTISLWARNLQLATYSIIVGLVSLFGQNPEFSPKTDFLHGYTAAVWFSILNNAFGGLLVAVVIKYADVILKDFSASASIVLTTFISAAFLGSSVNGFFAVGTFMVLYAMFLYGKVNPVDLLLQYVKTELSLYGYGKLSALDLKEARSPCAAK
jgi:UDP-sugar transporter A1/2/3